MDKKLAGLSGAAAALTTKTAAKAAPATDEATKGIPSDALFARRCRLPNASARELWYAGWGQICRRPTARSVISA